MSLSSAELSCLSLQWSELQGQPVEKAFSHGHVMVAVGEDLPCEIGTEDW